MFSMIPWKKKEPAGTELQLRRGNDPVSLMRSEFDNLFDRFCKSFFAPLEEWGMTPGWGLECTDTDKEIVVRAEAPGFDAEDFDVQVSGAWLTIRAQQQQPDSAGRAERRLERSLTLPPGADPEKVEARYRNGVLELHFAKRPEAQGQRIAVNTA